MPRISDTAGTGPNGSTRASSAAGPRATMTLPPVAALAIPIGRLLLRARREAVAHLPWHEMFRRSFWTAAGPTMKAIGVQMAVGMFFLSVIVGALTYVVLVNLIRRHRAKLAAALVMEGEREEAARAEQSPPPVD